MNLYKLASPVWISNNSCLRHSVRQWSIGSVLGQQAAEKYSDTDSLPRSNEEWSQAKNYDDMPGPGRIGMILKFLPGGALHNCNIVEMNNHLRHHHGDIFCVKGAFGKPDTVFTYNSKDIENVYRNEGVWPMRVGLHTFTYYRKEKRPDVFQGIGGLVSEQGKGWYDIRTKVNPVLMKPQNIRRNLPAVDNITKDFLSKLERLIDPATNTLQADFLEQVKMFSFEAMSFVALNTRMGLLTDNPDPNARRLFECMAEFFQKGYEYDVLPSFWRYYETPAFKRFMRVYDDITDITTSYVEAAIKKIESEDNKEAKSILEKLCRIDKQVAIVMAMDSLMAGIDTTTSTFITTLYLLGKNPEKQETLRREINTILPDPGMPLTEESTKHMPYTRACIKEALRITPITPGNFRTTVKDLVLSGYKVPKGTGVVMGNMELSNSEIYFPRSAEYLPERWLKSSENTCPVKATNPFVYLPFGFGPRTCIGKRIAELEMEVLLARLLRTYKVTWNSTEDLKYISNLILTPHGDVNFKFERL